MYNTLASMSSVYRRQIRHSLRINSHREVANALMAFTNILRLQWKSF